MKIDGYGSGGKITGPTKTDKKADAKKLQQKQGGIAGIEASSEMTGDTVELNSYQGTLNLVRELVDQSPDIRVEEVDRIVQKMKNDDYRVNLEKVAESFIREAILNELSKRKAGK